ncbi:MAG: nuclear transport factor 2 family protein [Pseudomonadota bacterium]
MTEQEAHLIQSACEALSVKFAFHVDHGNAEQVAALFAQDGTFSRAGKIIDGPDAIKGLLSKRPATRVTRHVCTNISIDITNEDAATGNTYFLLFEGEDTDVSGGALPLELPITLGEYQDEFIRTPAGWKISKRTAIGVFRRPEG